MSLHRHLVPFPFSGRLFPHLSNPALYHKEKENMKGCCLVGPHHAGKTGKRSKGAREKTETWEEEITTEAEATTGVRPCPRVRVELGVLGPRNLHACPKFVCIHLFRWVRGKKESGVRLIHPRWRQLPLQGTFVVKQLVTVISGQTDF